MRIQKLSREFPATTFDLFITAPMGYDSEDHDEWDYDDQYCAHLTIVSGFIRSLPKYEETRKIKPEPHDPDDEYIYVDADEDA